MRLISPGTHFNSGDGIRMAMQLGADLSGDWNGIHAEPIDARSKNSAPVVLVYPYGIVVDKNGRRFFDEGGGLVHETWEWFARDIHFKLPDSIAYAILDARLFEIADYQRAIRSEVPPMRADTLTELSELVGIMPVILPIPSRPTTPPVWAKRVVSTRRAVTGSRRHKRSDHRSRIGRAPLVLRRFWPTHWSAPSLTRSVALQRILALA